MLHAEPVSELYDYVLVGGGLQNGLIALALREQAPTARIALIERDQALGGNHTWCFHARDVPRSARSWVEPLVVQRWPRYEVHFPELQRVLDHTYAAIDSESLDRVVRARLAEGDGCSVITGQAATEVGADRVCLADGRVLRGFAVDARGPSPDAPVSGAGFQKFVGLELELEEPGRKSAPVQPVVMDATVPQTDGYRFVYVLPFASNRVLIEDTYFSDSPHLDREAVRARVLEYAERSSLGPVRVLREERGVLPMPWRAAPDQDRDGPLVAGYQGGWFHPGTGYSLPVAVRLATLIAEHAPSPLPAGVLAAHRRDHQGRARYARFLNWLLFRAARPDQRWNIFQRFYRLPEETILRFYSLEMSALDRARILVGRPPRGLRIPWGQPSPD